MTDYSFLNFCSVIIVRRKIFEPVSVSFETGAIERILKGQIHIVE